MDDLAAWLTQIWDEDEAAYRENLGEDYMPIDARFALARIAADRQILALHAVVVSDANHAPLGPTCSTCGAWEEYPEDWPCQTVKLLALPHADRPGYQEAWRPA